MLGLSSAGEGEYSHGYETIFALGARNMRLEQRVVSANQRASRDVPLAKNPSTATAQQRLFLVLKVVLHAVVVISKVLRLSTKSRCSRCCRAHLYAQDGNVARSPSVEATNDPTAIRSLIAIRKVASFAKPHPGNKLAMSASSDALEASIAG